VSLSAYALLFAAILIGVAGQLLLKHGVSRHPGFRLKDLAVLIRNLPIIGGLCCYAVATLLYLKVLASLDLSVAYPTVSLGYVLVVIMSHLLFGERVSVVRWLAIITICAGVALVGLTAG